MMKKLLILSLGIFTCFNAYSQLYIAHVYTDGDSAGAVGATYFLTISAPDGITSTIEIPSPYYYVNGVIVNDMSGHIQAINAELNTIINQGYSLVHVNNISAGTLGGLTYDTYYLAAPWTASGLNEMDSSMIDFIVSPLPANTYLNIKINNNYQWNSILLINSQGYTYFKKDITNISSGEEFTLDITNIPPGNYVITFVDNLNYLSAKQIVIM